jgi:hypothetical protein
VENISFTGEPISEDYLGSKRDPNRKRPHELAYEREDRLKAIGILSFFIIIVLALFVLEQFDMLDPVLNALRPYLM